MWRRIFDVKRKRWKESGEERGKERWAKNEQGGTNREKGGKKRRRERGKE